jgi:hypothetical protein
LALLSSRRLHSRAGSSVSELRHLFSLTERLVFLALHLPTQKRPGRINFRAVQGEARRNANIAFNCSCRVRLHSETAMDEV